MPGLLNPYRYGAAGGGVSASVAYSAQVSSTFSGPSTSFTPTGAAVDDVILFSACLPGSSTITKPSAWTTVYTQSNWVGFYGGETRVWGYKMQASDFTGGTPNAITLTTTAYQSYSAAVHVVRGLSGVPTTYTLTGPSTMSTSPLVVGAQTASTSAPKYLVFTGYISGGPIASVTFDAAALSPQGTTANQKAVRAAVLDANTSAANSTNTGNSRIDYLVLAVDLT